MGTMGAPMDDIYSLKPSRIVMYTTNYCSDCRRAKAFFEANNITYLQIGIEGNEQATRFIRELNNGFHSVPTIVFPDGSLLVEPSWEDLRKKFS